MNGSLRPDDALPPVRQIALNLGVHFNTVAEAYRVLADEGWLELKRGRGAIVLRREIPSRKPDPEEKAAFTRRVLELVAEVQANGLPARFLANQLRIVAEGLEK